MSVNVQGIQFNPLRTKQDLRGALQQLSDPLKPFYSEGSARLRLGTSGAAYPSAISEMEGFCRVLWGIVPLLAGGGKDELWDTCIKGIINGTNPEHPEYWGEAQDYDQRLVEMAVLGMALSLIPELVWEPLGIDERQHLFNWLNGINSHPVYDCNWLFFHVLVNIGFKTVGLPFDAEGMENNLLRIEAFDIGEGWYSDGIGGHSDYYVPFALHFYGLVYAKLMEAEDPRRSRMFKEKAALFAKDFICWFDSDGAALPYGRSLAYRFSQSAFWSALVFADVDVLPLGEVKGIVLRNLRWWFKQPIFQANGVLSVGYTYPNLIMAENYNSPGSPYWALKTFLLLALPDEHPFWEVEELPLPVLPDRSVQLPAHLVVCRDPEGSHVAAFNTGHPTTNEHTHTSAKYEKFVYSTAFGFSVPRAEWGLAQGAYDSMLALSEGDNLFRVRRRNEEYRIEDNVLYTRWKPWLDVEVKTWLIAGLPWHIRVHRIETGRKLSAAEGGFALSRDENLRVDQEALNLKAECSKGASGICGIFGYSKVEAVYPHSNTNLLYPRTVIPTLKAELDIGVHLLVSAVYGHPGTMHLDNITPGGNQWARSIPSITVEQGTIEINMLNGRYCPPIHIQ